MKKLELTESIINLLNESSKLSNIQGLEHYSENEIKQMAKDYIKEAMLHADYSNEELENFKIIDMNIYGSRNRGTAKSDSDLDIVFEYEGDFREDDLFNLLNDEEEPLMFEDIVVDFNPICAEKSGDMDSFMAISKQYDDEILNKKKTESVKSDEDLIKELQDEIARIDDKIESIKHLQLSYRGERENYIYELQDDIEDLEKEKQDCLDEVSNLKNFNKKTEGVQSDKDKSIKLNTFGIAEDMHNRTHKDKWHTLSDDEKADYYNKNYKGIKRQSSELYNDNKIKNLKVYKGKDYQRNAEYYDYYYVKIDNKDYPLALGGWNDIHNIKVDSNNIVNINDKKYKLDWSNVDKLNESKKVEGVQSDRQANSIKWLKDSGYEEYKTGDNYTALINKTKYDGQVVGAMFYGKSYKPAWHYRFKNIDELDKYIDEYLKKKAGQEEVKQQWKDKRKLTRDHDIKVGDIFYTSWGYDQTNIDFYEVVAVRGSRIDLRELKQTTVDHDGNYDSVVPVTGDNRFKDDEIHTVSARADGTVTSLSSFEYPSKWDGRPKDQTDAYSGH